MSATGLVARDGKGGPPPELFMALDAYQCRPHMRAGLDRAFRAVVETVEDLLSSCGQRQSCEKELAVALANIYLYLDFVSNDADLSLPDGHPFPRATELLSPYIRCSREDATYRWEHVPCTENYIDCTNAPEYALVLEGVESEGIPVPVSPVEGFAAAKRRRDPLAGGGYPLYVVSLPEDAERTIPSGEEAAPSPNKRFVVSRMRCVNDYDADPQWDGIGTPEFWNAMLEERLRGLRDERRLPIAMDKFMPIVNSILWR